MFPNKVTVRDMNPHLICALCGGYLIDATAIIECLHAFCKSCIVKHLETSRYCPICDVQVHKTRPLENIRPDHTLQKMVYKVVPGLYQNEMRSRRDFYRNHQENVPVSFEAKGEISDECSIFFPEESILLSLEYNSESSPSHQSSSGKRYLRCPAAVTILHLIKLIRSKFGLNSECKVDLFYKDEQLPEFLSLLDVAYMFQWRRKTPLHLSYRILEVRSQVVVPEPEKTEKSTPTEATSNVPGVEGSTLKGSVLDSVPGTAEELKEKWQEVQLQISENGVMSVAAAPEVPTSKENPKEKDIKEKDMKGKGIKEKNIKDTNLEEKMEIGDPENSEKPLKPLKPIITEEKLKTDTKDKKASLAEPKLELKKESVEVTTTVKDDSKTTTVNDITISLASDSKDKKKFEPVDKVTVKIDNGSISRDNASNKLKEEARKVEVKEKPKEVFQGKKEIEELKNKTVLESIAKAEAVWKASQSENAKKVCKVEPSLMGLPCGLSIIQRPALKTYPGLKPINPSKEDCMKTATSLSKEVSIKPIVSISTSSVAFPNKTDVSSSIKIPSSTTPIVPPSISKKPTPIRYKTLKSPTKPWNPSIPRSSMLMMKQNSTDNDPNQSKGNVKPPKFFKMRNNVPRYLGNPASGVKPMYQVSESSSTNNEAAQNSKLDLNSQKSGSSSGVTLMKIDPKTLSPIAVSSACSNPPSVNTNSTVSSHPKKSPLPPPYTPGSPKQSPIPKSKPVLNNKTPAHGTPLPSPAHSSSLLAANPFFGAANSLMYPSFPHPFSHAESANRILAGAANSQDLIRAMSSLCSPTAAFHPSLPPSLSMLFNTHQVGFPRLNPSANKSAPKTSSPKQLSPTVPSQSVPGASPSSYTPTPKPKKPITEPLNRARPNLTIETSRYNALYANGFLPSPTERHKSVSPKAVNKNEGDKKYTNKVVETLSKDRPSVKQSCPVEKKNLVEKMDVDPPPKREAKNISTDCDKDEPVSSNKRLKKDNSIESNNNFKVVTNAVRDKPKEETKFSTETPNLKESKSEVKQEPSKLSQSVRVDVSKNISVSQPVCADVRKNKAASQPACTDVSKNKSVSQLAGADISKNKSLSQSVCDDKNEAKTASQTVCAEKNKSKTVSNANGEIPSDNSQEDKNKSGRNETSFGCSISKSSCVSVNSAVGIEKPVEKTEDKAVIKSDCSDTIDRVDKVSSEASSKSQSECAKEQQVDKVSKSDVSLSVVNNNCKTSSSDTKQIASLVCSDSAPQVN